METGIRLWGSGGSIFLASRSDQCLIGFGDDAYLGEIGWTLREGNYSMQGGRIFLERASLTLKEDKFVLTNPDQDPDPSRALVLFDLPSIDPERWLLMPLFGTYPVVLPIANKPGLLALVVVPASRTVGIARVWPRKGEVVNSPERVLVQHRETHKGSWFDFVRYTTPRSFWGSSDYGVL